MPPKRSTHVGPAPAPLVPEPRAAFAGALDRLVPVVEHDFSIHPATFHAIDQRLAVLALYLFRDSCYREPHLPPAGSAFDSPPGLHSSALTPSLRAQVTPSTLEPRSPS